MSQPQQQQPGLHPQQVVDAARVGAEFFSLETTLVPGNIRRAINVLEVVLQNIGTGNFVVVTREQLELQSKAAQAQTPAPEPAAGVPSSAENDTAVEAPSP